MTEHDEALVERVAQLLELQWLRGNKCEADNTPYTDKARAVIYPPAPPKTRLQVARELLAEADRARECTALAEWRLAGRYDSDAETAAVMAALALPQMKD